MSETNDTLLMDYRGRRIRLTQERYQHILEHPEMLGQEGRIRETISQPDHVVSTTADPSVHVYSRYYDSTPVTRKFLLVVVKTVEEDAYILTAFFASRQKKGITVWAP